MTIVLSFINSAIPDGTNCKIFNITDDIFTATPVDTVTITQNSAITTILRVNRNYKCVFENVPGITFAQEFFTWGAISSVNVLHDPIATTSNGSPIEGKGHFQVQALARHVSGVCKFDNLSSGSFNTNISSQLTDSVVNNFDGSFSFTHPIAILRSGVDVIVEVTAIASAPTGPSVIAAQQFTAQIDVLDAALGELTNKRVVCEPTLAITADSTFAYPQTSRATFVGRVSAANAYNVRIVPTLFDGNNAFSPGSTIAMDIFVRVTMADN